MIKTSVAIKGLTELAQAFDEYEEKQLRPKVTRGLKEHAEKVANTAKGIARRASGAYAESIHADMAKSGMSGVVKTDAKKAPHAHLAHFGTTRMTGDFALYKASDRHESELADTIQRHVDE